MARHETVPAALPRTVALVADLVLERRGVPFQAPPPGRYVPVANMNVARGYHTATLLGDGTVLLTGGFVQGTSIPSAKPFHP